MQNLFASELLPSAASQTRRHFFWCTIAFSFISISSDAHGNRVDRIDPSVPGFTDEYFVAVHPDSPIVSLTETGISRRATFRGQRDVVLDLNGGTSAYSSKQYADSFLELNNDANTSAILTLDYGADNFQMRPIENRFNAIAVSVSEVNSGDDGLSLGSGRFTLTLRSGSTRATSINGIDFDHPGVYYLSFDDPGFKDIQFNHLNEVAITLTTTTMGSDIRIESIYRVAIPEPSTWFLFGLGGAGIVGWDLIRRRTRRATS